MNVSLNRVGLHRKPMGICGGHIVCNVDHRLLARNTGKNTAITDLKVVGVNSATGVQVSFYDTHVIA
jgi:hypothetical protein